MSVTKATKRKNPQTSTKKNDENKEAAVVGEKEKTSL